jgi:DNA-binding beta-propeller fold protein YncE
MLIAPLTGLLAAVLAAAVVTVGCGGATNPPSAAAPAASTAGSNSDNGSGYRVDPFWPKRLPNNWILGQVAGLAVDANDHIWIIHRPASLTPEEAAAAQTPPAAMCCVPAPPVIEFDTEGNVVQAWGGPGDGYDWFQVEHGIHVDPQGNVWVGGNGDNDNHVVKFTRDGKFLLQIGKSGQRGGSNDQTTLGGPAAVEVDADANEVYIADGYKNKRVVVFDATTGAYKRHWGGYGEPPVDGPLLPPTEQNLSKEPFDPAAPPSRQFRGPVHGVAISRDGLVYVTDRMGNRVQVFQKNGEFVNELLIRPETRSLGTAWDVALSRDAEQQWLFVSDGSNHVLWPFDRKTLKVGDPIGSGGRNAGQFGWVHNLDVDSHGNVYTAEVETGKRVQKFTPLAR